MSSKYAVLMLALAAAASAQKAAAQATVSFTSAGIRFDVPLPSGYCLPRGPFVEFAQQIATADVQNVTHLTLYRCDQQSGDRVVDYILIKTPRPALGTRITREQLMADLGREFAAIPAGGSLLSDESVDAIEGRIASALGRQLEMTGSVRPLGRDSVCAYLGGIFALTMAGGTHNVSAGACVTSVAERIITVNWYGADRGSAGVAALLARARRLATLIRGRAAP
ncbi:MAG TPA: hypothetical protein VEC11_12145 [Allosphingosinicella sp.]|nr:hypothetical protein [Allosphingosinicella sp.]